ncbi:uncharacterized protein LOC115803818 [Delphinapterus leucas]|uniref:Uncharacterized protein LOC115803818 n=1 Tax=Delphinapterus leucas TaxID=9749 RepID=A0A7F8K9Z2_DELLE|nr:uncharacterized protein LOC115803818 [Delphinapterus leucas]
MVAPYVRAEELAPANFVLGGGPGEGAPGGPGRRGEEVTGGGDLPALGAGRTGEAPGAGRTPSRRALGQVQELLSQRPAPSARGPGPRSLGSQEAPSSLRAWRRRRRRRQLLLGSWVGLGCGASTCTPSPSGALRLAAELTARDPGPVPLIPCPLCDRILGLGALPPSPIGPTRAEVSSPEGC